MTVAIALHLLLVGCIAALAAVFGEQAARSLRLPTRHIWALALLLTFGAPLLALAVGSAEGTRETPVVVDAVPSAALPSDIAVLPQPERPLIPEVVLPAWVVRVDSLALALWGVAVLVALVRLASAHWRLRRQSAAWPEVDIKGHSARLSSGTGPAVAGVLRPFIVIPEWTLESTLPVVRLMLAHEREHIRARDPLLLLLADIAVALAPWHPALHWQRKRLRLAVEMDCDARVLRTHRDTRRYAELLLRVAQRPALSSGHPAAAVALAPRPSTLERRIAAMTENRSRSPLAALAAASAAAILGMAACEAPMATAPEPEHEITIAEIAAELERSASDSVVLHLRRDATAAAADTSILLRGDGIIMADTLLVIRNRQVRDSMVALRQRGELDTEKPLVALYMVDGVIVRGVDALEGLGIAPNRIETVEVLKGSAATRTYGPVAAQGVVSIRLRDGEPLPVPPAPPTGFQVLHGVPAAPDAPRPLEVRPVPPGPAGTVKAVPPVEVRPLPARPSPAPQAAPSVRALPARPPAAPDVPPSGFQVIPVPPAAPPAAPPSAVIMGEDGAVRLRGPESSGNGPIVMVDGVILTDPDGLQSLDPERIQSVEVIKGAAAVRLYGSRAANGVVVVTTKR